MVLATLVAGFAALFGVGAWLLAGAAFGWEGDQLTLSVTVASGAGAILGSAFAQPLFGAALERLLEPGDPGVPSPEVLDLWCARLRWVVLHRRISGERSQREQMLRGNELIDQLASPALKIEPGPGGRPKVRMEGSPRPWSQWVEAWSDTGGRMVIVGEPGYGKTFAALTLVAHINAKGAEVAELFPLVDWHAWSAGQKDNSIDAWLVDQLTQNYPELLTRPAAEAIVMQGRLVPVFDGLDEVPEAGRSDCRDALTLYAGREAPFRSFVVTCRQREYFALAPKWIGAEKHVALIGLDAERIAATLRQSVGHSSGWTSVIDAIEGGDRDLVALLRSPLRLVAAIDVYQGGNPRELVDLATRDDAREQLWDGLLRASPQTFGDASAAEVRRWLSFLAASLQSHDRQRFWLHELYLYASAAHRRRFFVAAGCLFVLAGSTAPLLQGTIAGKLLAGLNVGIAVAGYFVLRDKPFGHVLRAPVAARHYIRALPEAALVAVLFAIAWVVVCGPLLLGILVLSRVLGGETIHLGASVVSALQVSGVTGCVVALSTATAEVLDVGTTGVAEEPPAQLAGQGPDAVIRATRNHGLVVTALTLLAIAAPVAAWRPDSPQVWGAAATVAAVNGIVSGLGSWAYFHWTRLSLSASGLLPRRLRAFLDWAANDTGWLRVSGAYEFRHKDLLDYLAQDAEPVGAGNLSWAEANARSDPRGISQAESRRGDRLMRAEDYEGALKAYSTALETAPTPARLHRRRSNALEKLGRHKEQLRAASAAVDYSPSDPSNLSSLSVAHERLGNLEAALESARLAVELGPDSTQRQANLAIILAKLGRDDDVLTALGAALELRPRDSRLKEMRDKAAIRAKRHERRLVAARLRAAREPESVDAHWDLAVAERRMGHRGEAATARERVVSLALEQAAGRRDYRPLLGWRLNSRGYSCDAARLVEPIVAGPAAALGASLDLAHAYCDLGRTDEADRILAAVQPRAETPSDHNSLANALVVRGRCDDALSHVEVALRAQPDNATFAFTRAEVSLARSDLASFQADLAAAFPLAKRLKVEPGEPAWFCRLLWRRTSAASREQFVDLIFERFASEGVVASLADGLIDGTPTSPDQTGWDAGQFALWCAAWRRHEGLRPAVQILMELSEGASREAAGLSG